MDNLEQLIPDKSLLDRVKSLTDQMPISRVVMFFDRENISFTKTMIQNYVRVGVLPSPKEKRYYTKNHILLLYIIDKLKRVYSLDEIKNIFSGTIFDDDSGEFFVDMFLVCRCYFEFYENCISEFVNQLPNLKSEIDIVASSQDNKSAFANFLLKFSTMTQAAASKDLTDMSY